MLNPYRSIFIITSIVVVILLVIGVILPPLISTNELPAWCIVVLTAFIFAMVFSAILFFLKSKN